MPPILVAGTVSLCARVVRTALLNRFVARPDAGRSVLVLCAALAATPGAWAQAEAEPSAEGAVLSAEAQAYSDAQAAASAAYGTCLTEHEGSWITAPDYSACDAERAGYARYLPADAAELVLGCFEEQVVGSARTEGLGCAAFEARFVEAEALGTPSDEPSTEAAP